MRNFYSFLAPEDGTGTTPAATTPPAADDTAGLKATIAALRSDLKRYEGIDPEAARTALSQIPTLQEANKALSDKLNISTIDNAVSQVVTGALPQYSGLLASNARGLLQVNDKGEVVSSDGKSLADLGNQFRTQYPAMFVAETAPVGSGAAATTTSATPPPASVVDAPNGIISGVSPDAIIGGQVKINAT